MTKCVYHGKKEFLEIFMYAVAACNVYVFLQGNYKGNIYRCTICIQKMSKGISGDWIS